MNGFLKRAGIRTNYASDMRCRAIDNTLNFMTQVKIFSIRNRAMCFHIHNRVLSGRLKYTHGYKVVYLLIYSKDDIIRKTEGTHSLI